MDRFLAMHPAVQLVAVVAAIFVAALLVAAGIHLADAGESRGVGEEFWWTLTRMVDGGTVAGDAGPIRRVLGMLITFGGLIAVAVLTGAFASGFAARLEALRRGTLPIFERRHVLLLGYNPHAGVIVRELAVSRARLRLVIVSDHERDDIEERIREQLSGLSHRLTIIARRGDPTTTATLRRAAARRARAIVVLPEAPGDDAQRAHRSAVRSLLAIRRVLRGRRVPLVLDVSHAGDEAIRLCVEPSDTIICDAVEINARVLAQSIREPGAYDVVRQILSLDARSLFMHPAGAYVGMTFDEAHAAIERGVLLGLVRDGTAMLSPSERVVIGKDDQLVFFGETPAPPHGAATLPEPAGPVDVAPLSDPELRVLAIRYKPDLLRVLACLEASARVKLTLLAAGEELAQARAALGAAALSRTSIEIEAGDPLEPDRIHAALQRAPNAVVIVAPEVGASSIEDADADQILTLLHLRRHLATHAHVVVEIRSAETPRLVPRAGRGRASEDFVLSRELVGMLLAQEVHALVAMDRGRSVQGYGELFVEVASRIRLRPAPRYVEERAASFAEVMAVARARGEIAIGVAMPHERPALLPDRGARIPASGEARIVVLAPAARATAVERTACAPAKVG